MDTFDKVVIIIMFATILLFITNVDDKVSKLKAQPQEDICVEIFRKCILTKYTTPKDTACMAQYLLCKDTVKDE